MVYDIEANELNSAIENGSSVFWEFLSDNGKEAFFPTHGVLGQSVASKGAKINATIGIGLDDNGDMLSLPAIASKIDLPGKKVFPYISSFGLSELRVVWKKKMLEKNPSLDNDKISLPVITGGLTHALSVARYLFDVQGSKNDVGDILSYDFFWTNYNLIFGNGSGHKLVTFPTFVLDEESKKYKFDFGSLKKEISSREKVIVCLNFPNNPSGYSLTVEEQEQMVSMLLDFAKKGKRLLVICDDAYFGLFYEKDIAKESIFAKLANLHENIAAIKVDGPTKEELVWGLRVGCITFANKGASLESLKALESKAAGVIRKTVSNVSTLSQNLILSSLKSKNNSGEKKNNFNILKERYSVCRKLLDENKKSYSEYFTVLPFNSGYFLCLKLDDSFDCDDVRLKLLNDHSIAVIALPFGNLLRVAFSSVAVANLPIVFEKIVQVCSELQS